MDYMEVMTQRNAIPYISKNFLDYEANTLLDKTGSFLSPMVTTIGLYSGLNLVGIAKLGSPIKIPMELPINFVIKLDF